jgi:hypothetical protein
MMRSHTYIPTYLFGAPFCTMTQANVVHKYLIPLRSFVVIVMLKHLSVLCYNPSATELSPINTFPDLQS